jgi:hypothetical protein
MSADQYRLLNVLPGPALQHFVHRREADAILACQLDTRRFTSIMSSASVSYGMIGESSNVVRFASLQFFRHRQRSATPMASLYRVPIVIRRCAGVEMGRVDAGRIVAVMKYPQPIRNRAVGQFVRIPVSLEHDGRRLDKTTARNPEHPIAGRQASRRPQPARTKVGAVFGNGTIAVNLCPEPFRTSRFARCTLACSRAIHSLRRSAFYRARQTIDGRPTMGTGRLYLHRDFPLSRRNRGVRPRLLSQVRGLSVARILP